MSVVGGMVSVQARRSGRVVRRTSKATGRRSVRRDNADYIHSVYTVFFWFLFSTTATELISDISLRRAMANLCSV